MRSSFSDALSGALSKHIALPPARRGTLAWLTLLIMRQGTICLWHLAAHIACAAPSASARRRFCRVFQFMRRGNRADRR